MWNKPTLPLNIILLAVWLITGCETRIWRNPLDPNISPADWAPRKLTFYMLSPTEVELRWRQYATQIETYLIERARDENLFRDYGMTSECVFRDTDLQPDYRYRYRVRGIMHDKESESCEPITIGYVKMGEMAWSGAQDGYIYAVGVTPDSRTAFTASYDNSVCAWDMMSGARRWEVRHNATVWSLDVNARGDRICTASGDRTVRVWQVSDGRQKWSVTGNDMMWSVCFSPDGSMVACGGYNEIILCNAGTGKQKFHADQTGPIKKVAFSPDNRYLAVGGHEEVRVYRTSNGATRWSAAHPNVVDVTFSLDGERIVSGGEDNRIRCWSAESGALLWENAVAGQISSLVCHPDRATIYSGSWDGRVAAWNITDGVPRWTAFLGGRVYALDCSADSSFVVAGCGDRTIRALDASTGAPLWNSSPHLDEVRALKITPNSLKVISGGGLAAAGRPVRVWWTRNSWQQLP